MRILLTGAAGFIGAAILHELAAAGHAVVAVTRRPPRPGLAAATWLRLDLRKAGRPTDWLPHLQGIDAVVNCAGVFQDGPRDATAAVHAESLAALVTACEAAGVRRLVQISAIGAEADAPTAFARSKQQGDDAVMRSGLDWVVLRPSVVLGRAAYGGSAALRGLAALPVLPVLPGTGLLQVVQLDEVARTVRLLVEPQAPARQVLELAGPEALSFAAVVATYRCWLGWRPAVQLPLPACLAGLLFRAGDLLGRQGWRPPLRSTAALEMARGSVGDPSGWMRLTGIRPRSLSEALAAEPATVQERWFARLYLLKPLALGSAVLFWIATGLIALGPGWRDGLGVMEQAGAAALAPLAVAGGALADIAIGAAIAVRGTARRGLWAAVGLSALYAVAGSVVAPYLWADPLGPLLKILPILLLHLLLLAILDDR